MAGLPYELQYEMARKVVDQCWSLRKLEKEDMVTNERNTSDELFLRSKIKDPDINALEKAISRQIGSETKLEIDPNKKDGGWLKIRYFNNEILTGILEKLGVNQDE